MVTMTTIGMSHSPSRMVQDPTHVDIQSAIQQAVLDHEAVLHEKTATWRVVLRDDVSPLLVPDAENARFAAVGIQATALDVPTASLPVLDLQLVSSIVLAQTTLAVFSTASTLETDTLASGLHAP